MFPRYEGDGPAIMLLVHVGLEVGRGEVHRILFLEDPVAAKAVGNAAEDRVQVQGLALAQATFVLMAGGVQTGVQTGLDPPVRDIFLQPLLGGEFGAGAAREQAEALRLCPHPLTPDARGLGGKGMAELFRRHFDGGEGVHHRFSFLLAFFADASLIAFDV
jgi:hypothetical protein